MRYGTRFAASDSVMAEVIAQRDAEIKRLVADLAATGALLARALQEVSELRAKLEAAQPKEADHGR